MLSLFVICCLVMNKKSKYENNTVGIINKPQEILTKDYNFGRLKEKKKSTQVKITLLIVNRIPLFFVY